MTLGLRWHLTRPPSLESPHLAARQTTAASSRWSSSLWTSTLMMAQHHNFTLKTWCHLQQKPSAWAGILSMWRTARWKQEWRSRPTVSVMLEEPRLTSQAIYLAGDQVLWEKRSPAWHTVVILSMKQRIPTQCSSNAVTPHRCLWTCPYYFNPRFGLVLSSQIQQQCTAHVQCHCRRHLRVHGRESVWVCACMCVHVCVCVHACMLVRVRVTVLVMCCDKLESTWQYVSFEDNMVFHLGILKRFLLMFEIKTRLCGYHKRFSV